MQKMKWLVVCSGLVVANIQGAALHEDQPSPRLRHTPHPPQKPRSQHLTPILNPEQNPDDSYEIFNLPPARKPHGRQNPQRTKAPSAQPEQSMGALTPQDLRDSLPFHEWVRESMQVQENLGNDYDAEEMIMMQTVAFISTPTSSPNSSPKQSPQSSPKQKPLTIEKERAFEEVDEKKIPEGDLKSQLHVFASHKEGNKRWRAILNINEKNRTETLVESFKTAVETRLET